MSPLPQRHWAPGSLQGAEAVAEAIASRDLNNLYRTSCYFADGFRYASFCALYAVMRIVDDRVDAIPARAELTPAERRREHDVVDAWQSVVVDCYAWKAPEVALLGTTDCAEAREVAEAFRAAIGHFPVPQRLWGNFFQAMHRDIDRPRFETYKEFLEYAEGATVAPTTIYLYLLAAERPDGVEFWVTDESFDLIAAGRALGVFAYLGHILRDLAEDLATGTEGLVYLAADDMRRHGVTEDMLFSDLARGETSSEVRSLAAELIGRSRQELSRGRQFLAPLQGKQGSDRAFILALIIALYEAVLDKIEACGCDVFAGRHRLTPGEKEAIALRVASRAW